MRTLDLVHAAQGNPQPVTIRDIYYQDVALYRNQACSNLAINTLAKIIGVSREEMNIVAGSKELILGEVDLSFPDGMTWTGSPTIPQILPNRIHQLQVIKPPLCLKTIVIVEKEAVFNNLVQLAAKDPSVLLVTGKGFPGNALISFLQKMDKDLRVYLLVDWDPYGLEIAFYYQKKLAPLNVIHLAATADQIFGKPYLRSKTIRLNLADAVKIKSLFNRLPKESSLIREAIFMLEFGAKLELDVIESEEIWSYLPKK